MEFACAAPAKLGFAQASVCTIKAAHKLHPVYRSFKADHLIKMNLKVPGALKALSPQSGFILTALRGKTCQVGASPIKHRKELSARNRASRRLALRRR